MSVIIECRDTGIIYRNPSPNIKSIHAFYPSVIELDNNEMIAAMSLGEAIEASNLNVNISRSKDGGKTWRLEGPIYQGTADRITSNAGRLTKISENEIIFWMIRHDRSRENTGLTNPATTGFVPTELLLLRSFDHGCTWTNPEKIVPPLYGPCFDNSNVFVLNDGSWNVPMTTWMDWDGNCTEGVRMVNIISKDKGQTWPEYVVAMEDKNQEIMYVDDKIIEMPDGRVVIVAWAINYKKGYDLPNQFTISCDGGKTYNEIKSTGIKGQVLTPILLDDGKILSIYREFSKGELRANLSMLDGEDWIILCEKVLWSTQNKGSLKKSNNVSRNFSACQFGAPNIIRMKNGEFFCTFWCIEDCISNIRWVRIGCKS